MNQHLLKYLQRKEDYMFEKTVITTRDALRFQFPYYKRIQLLLKDKINDTHFGQS